MHIKERFLELWVGKNKICEQLCTSYALFRKCIFTANILEEESAMRVMQRYLGLWVGKNKIFERLCVSHAFRKCIFTANMLEAKSATKQHAYISGLWVAEKYNFGTVPYAFVLRLEIYFYVEYARGDNFGNTETKCSAKPQGFYFSFLSCFCLCSFKFLFF